MKLDATDLADLRPLLAETVRQTLAELQASDDRLSDRLAYSEPEAAAALGLATHVLRDARLAGRIPAARCGRRVLYDRRALQAWLAAGGTE